MYLFLPFFTSHTMAAVLNIIMGRKKQLMLNTCSKLHKPTPSVGHSQLSFSRFTVVRIVSLSKNVSDDDAMVSRCYCCCQKS